MKRYLILLATLPALAACGDAADESDNPPAATGTDIAGSSDGSATDALAPSPGGDGAVDPAATSAATQSGAGIGIGSSTGAAPAPAPVRGAGSTTGTVPATNQDAQYQDSVTEAPEVAP